MPDESDVPPELQRLRDSIDNLDAALVHLLSERFKLTRAVGEFKAREALAASDKGREQRQIARLRELSEQAQLDPAIAEKFLVFIISEVVRHHEAIADEHQANGSALPGSPVRAADGVDGARREVPPGDL